MVANFTFTAKDNISPVLSNIGNRLNVLNNQLNRFGKGINLRGFSSFAYDVNKIKDSVDHLYKATARYFRYVVGSSIVLGGIGIFTKSIKNAIDFEESMARVNASLQLNRKEQEKMKKLAITLGLETPFSQKEAAEGIRALAKQGVTAKEILDSLSSSGKLAKNSIMDLVQSFSYISAGEVDLNFAAKIIARARNYFQVAGNVKDLNKIVQGMVELSLHSPVEFEDWYSIIKGYRASFIEAKRFMNLPEAFKEDDAFKFYSRLIGGTPQQNVQIAHTMNALASILRTQLEASQSGMYVGMFFNRIAKIIADLGKEAKPITQRTKVSTAVDTRAGSLEGVWVPSRITITEGSRVGRSVSKKSSTFYSGAMERESVTYRYILPQDRRGRTTTQTVTQVVGYKPPNETWAIFNKLGLSLKDFVDEATGKIKSPELWPYIMEARQRALGLSKAEIMAQTRTIWGERPKFITNLLSKEGTYMKIAAQDALKYEDIIEATRIKEEEFIRTYYKGSNLLEKELEEHRKRFANWKKEGLELTGVSRLIFTTLQANTAAARDVIQENYKKIAETVKGQWKILEGSFEQLGNSIADIFTGIANKESNAYRMSSIIADSITKVNRIINYITSKEGMERISNIFINTVTTIESAGSVIVKTFLSIKDAISSILAPIGHLLGTGESIRNTFEIIGKTIGFYFTGKILSTLFKGIFKIREYLTSTFIKAKNIGPFGPSGPTSLTPLGPYGPIIGPATPSATTKGSKKIKDKSTSYANMRFLRFFREKAVKFHIADIVDPETGEIKKSFYDKLWLEYKRGIIPKPGYAATASGIPYSERMKFIFTKQNIIDAAKNFSVSYNKKIKENIRKIIDIDQTLRSAKLYAYPEPLKALKRIASKKENLEKDSVNIKLINAYSYAEKQKEKYIAKFNKLIDKLNVLKEYAATSPKIEKISEKIKEYIKIAKKYGDLSSRLEDYFLADYMAKYENDVRNFLLKRKKRLDKEIDKITKQYRTGLFTPYTTRDIYLNKENSATLSKYYKIIDNEYKGAAKAHIYKVKELKIGEERVGILLNDLRNNTEKYIPVNKEIGKELSKEQTLRVKLGKYLSNVLDKTYTETFTKEKQSIYIQKLIRAYENEISKINKVTTLYGQLGENVYKVVKLNEKMGYAVSVLDQATGQFNLLQRYTLGAGIDRETLTTGLSKRQMKKMDKAIEKLEKYGVITPFLQNKIATAGTTFWERFKNKINIFNPGRILGPQGAAAQIFSLYGPYMKVFGLLTTIGSAIDNLIKYKGNIGSTVLGIGSDFINIISSFVGIFSTNAASFLKDLSTSISKKAESWATGKDYELLKMTTNLDFLTDIKNELVELNKNLQTNLRELIDEIRKKFPELPPHAAEQYAKMEFSKTKEFKEGIDKSLKIFESTLIREPETGIIKDSVKLAGEVSTEKLMNMFKDFMSSERYSSAVRVDVQRLLSAGAINEAAELLERTYGTTDYYIGATRYLKKGLYKGKTEPEITKDLLRETDIYTSMYKGFLVESLKEFPIEFWNYANNSIESYRGLLDENFDKLLIFQGKDYAIKNINDFIRNRERLIEKTAKNYYGESLGDLLISYNQLNNLQKKHQEDINKKINETKITLSKVEDEYKTYISTLASYRGGYVSYPAQLISSIQEKKNLIKTYKDTLTTLEKEYKLTENLGKAARSRISKEILAEMEVKLGESSASLQNKAIVMEKYINAISKGNDQLRNDLIINSRTMQDYFATDMEKFLSENTEMLGRYNFGAYIENIFKNFANSGKKSVEEYINYVKGKLQEFAQDLLSGKIFEGTKKVFDFKKFKEDVFGKTESIIPETGFGIGTGFGTTFGQNLFGYNPLTGQFDYGLIPKENLEEFTRKRDILKELGFDPNQITDFYNSLKKTQDLIKEEKEIVVDYSKVDQAKDRLNVMNEDYMRIMEKVKNNPIEINIKGKNELDNLIASLTTFNEVISKTMGIFNINIGENKNTEGGKNPPKKHGGGYIFKSGFYELDKGETVVSKSQSVSLLTDSSNRSRVNHINIVINGVKESNAQEIANLVIEKLNRYDIVKREENRKDNFYGKRAYKPVSNLWSMA